MKNTELEAYRVDLLNLRTRLGSDVAHLADEALHRDGDQSSGNLSHLPLHMADVGTDNYEQENTLNLLAREERLLKEIDAALDRLDKGTFGRCEECQGPIVPKGRLKELPYTRYCVDCARKLDQSKS